MGLSLLGDIIGGIGTSHALKNISDQWMNAEQGELGATKNAQTGVENATANATGAIGNQLQNFQPYIDAGKQGVQGLQNYAASNPQFSFNPQDLEKTPGYQFQLQQGTQAIQNSASAMGLGNSGAALKELTQYGQGLAGTYYQNAFNNALGTFNTNQNATMQNLGALINTGQYGNSQALSGTEYGGALGLQGANISGQMGMQGANLAGNYAIGYGNALANKTQAGYGAWGNIIGDAAGAVAGGLTGMSGGGGLGGFATGVAKGLGG